MGMIVKHIDKIAREKQRDVIYIDFFENLGFDYDYEHYPTRVAFMQWMDEHEIKYIPCGYRAREDGWESYRGTLYIDVPMDTNNPKFLLLNEHLENEDGSFKIEGIFYYYLPLEVAMKNAHHDEPGFWEKWAEDF